MTGPTPPVPPDTPVPKSELEFLDPLAGGRFAWAPVAGDATGALEEIVLAGAHEAGHVTRLLRFPPGADTSPNGTLTHEVWEEVWIVSGSITDLRLGETFTAGMYACRPPGMEHGPWASPDGAVTFEVRYPGGPSGG